MANGRFTHCTFVSQRRTDRTLNDAPLIELTFKFIADDGSQNLAKVETIRPNDWSELQLQPLFYAANNPQRSLLMRELPIDFDEQGNLTARGPIANALSLTTPLVVILGHGIWFCHIVFGAP